MAIIIDNIPYNAPGQSILSGDNLETAIGKIEADRSELRSLQRAVYQIESNYFNLLQKVDQYENRIKQLEEAYMELVMLGRKSET